MRWYLYSLHPNGGESGYATILFPNHRETNGACIRDKRRTIRYFLNPSGGFQSSSSSTLIFLTHLSYVKFLTISHHRSYHCRYTKRPTNNPFRYCRNHGGIKAGYGYISKQVIGLFEFIQNTSIPVPYIKEFISHCYLVSKPSRRSALGGGKCRSYISLKLLHSLPAAYVWTYRFISILHPNGR